MKAIGRLLGVGAVLAIVVVAVASEARRADGPATIVLEDFRFTPNRIDATAGVPLTVRLTNKGTEIHDLNFESVHMPGLGGVEAMLRPGESKTITLSFTEAGTHVFICTLPGHATAGMTGAAYVAQ